MPFNSKNPLGTNGNILFFLGMICAFFRSNRNPYARSGIAQILAL